MGNTNIFGPLYAIYEEEGEDEDWFECYPHLLVIYILQEFDRVGQNLKGKS